MDRGTDVTHMKRAYRKRNEGDFPDNLKIILKKDSDKKYGENPNQHCAVYIVDWFNTKKIKQLTDLQYVRSDGKGKGGLSLTNEMDIARAADNLKFFQQWPTAVIMKHNIVSGFAKQTKKEQKLKDLFRLARDADLRSNFGGTAVFNRPLDLETVEAMYELKGKSPFFVDVLAAPGYEEGVLPYLENESRNLRIGEFRDLDGLPKFQGDNTYGLLSIKEMPGGRVGIQDIYLTSIKSADDFVLDPMVIDKEENKHIIEKDPDKRELDDLLTAWYLNIAGARSNGVVFVKNGVSVAIGSGQVERVGAIEQAVVKGMQKAMNREGIKYDPLLGIRGYKQLSEDPFQGAVCSSDAFFPFDDSVQILARVGVTAAVQPYGSIRDDIVIDAANKYKIAMPATLERCFGHF